MKTRYYMIMALTLGLMMCSCKANYNEIENFSENTWVTENDVEWATREMEVPDYHTIIVSRNVDLHYTTDEGAPYLKVTGHKYLVEWLRPRVDNGVLILNPRWPIGNSGWCDTTIVVETNSHQLTGFGHEEVALGRLSRELKRSKKIDWEEDFLLHCWTMNEYEAEEFDSIMSFDPTVKYFVNYPPYTGYRLSCHRDGGKTRLDMVNESETDLETVRGWTILQGRTRLPRSSKYVLVNGENTIMPSSYPVTEEVVAVEEAEEDEK